MIVNYLEFDDLMRVNAAVLDAHPKLRERELLEAAVARPQASAFGQDAYPTLHDKAAALFHSLILNHPFVDGNKRTAVVGAVLFLRWHGIEVAWTVDDAYTLVMATAARQHDVAAISAWLAARSSTHQ